MNPGRIILLWASQNKWMKKNIPRVFFIKKALLRFMPGENIEDALKEAIIFNQAGIGAVFTKLGENINTLADADSVTGHYLDILAKIKDWDVAAEISLKLTQIGLDISEDAARNNFKRILQTAADKNYFVWIDMEQSSYVDRTINFYKHFRRDYSNVGICLQSYLRRTKSDVNKLLPAVPNIRLVKGAYMESHETAFAQKALVDKNYFELAQLLLNYSKDNKARIAFATHDTNLISRIKKYAEMNNIPNSKFEFQMLYGIKSGEQVRIAGEGYNMRVLISYGAAWYSWYMRRLAERPANIWFVLKNIFTK